MHSYVDRWAQGAGWLAIFTGLGEDVLCLLERGCGHWIPSSLLPHSPKPMPHYVQSDACSPGRAPFHLRHSSIVLGLLSPRVCFKHWVHRSFPTIPKKRQDANLRCFRFPPQLTWYIQKYFLPFFKFSSRWKAMTVHLFRVFLPESKAFFHSPAFLTWMSFR